MKSYTITDSYKFLDVSPLSKKYVLTIRDLPIEDKPREKFLKLGASSLSAQELLAIILNTGTKKEGVLEMSGRVLKEYGEKALIMGKVDVKKFATDLGIPLIKATQIAASIELGRRFFEKKNAQMPVIRTPKDIYEYLADMRSLPKEHLRGLYLNSHYKLIHDEVISIGTIDANIIHPREVFRPALEYSAVAVILAHNHPTGNPKASEADIAVTAQIIEAGKIMGIKVLDHVIICKDKFGSVPADY
ncbi:MAG: repair protein RadC [Candidatus Taylorbacteria bacterium]|nr:repair protein RadC [Candidatus Taylorbacteria bacterium]